ncbi:MAG: hypothetical protein U0457_05265 [Candidatus Sericytochromatia bacterium]
MPSITSNNLFQRVTRDYSLRRIQETDPSRFSKTLLQISDQQSRDKQYEKGLEYLRTYIASLQAKLNTLVEELNGIYDNMLNQILYKKADSKDTSKLLNVLPNATNTDPCTSAIAKYDPKSLEITPYSNNVRNYMYNTMFGSKGLDLANYYDYSQTNNTTVARSYYEQSDPNVSDIAVHHELGASVFGTLNYLWQWDLDRVNATYATTKDSFIDDSGRLHVPPGDPRAGSPGVVEDSSLSIATSLQNPSGGNTNNLQVNVTDLQPNRGVFLPGTEKGSTDVVMLDESFEKKTAMSGWITTYDHSGSMASGNTLLVQVPIDPNDLSLGYVLKPAYEGMNQWGIDETPPITNNPLQFNVDLAAAGNVTNSGAVGTPPVGGPSNPPPLYSTTEPAGLQSGHSAHFGNIKVVTYDDIVYAPHSTYRFDPSVVREHFNDPVSVSGATLLGTSTGGWQALGNTNLIDSAPSYDTHAPYQAPFTTNPAGLGDPIYGTPQRNTLDISYFNGGLDAGNLTIKSPTFNLSGFEGVTYGGKQYYKLNPYGYKYVYDLSHDFEGYPNPAGGADYDVIIEEQLRNANNIDIKDDTGSTIFQTTDTIVTQAKTFGFTQHDPYANIFFSNPNWASNTNFNSYDPGTSQYIFKNFVSPITYGSVGSSNASMSFDFIEKPKLDPTGDLTGGVQWLYDYPLPGYSGYPTGYINTPVDFRKGGQTVNVNMQSDGHNDTPIPWWIVAASPYVPVSTYGPYSNWYGDPRSGGDLSAWIGTASGLPNAAAYESGAAHAYQAANIESEATRWQLDDVYMKATGYSKGEMITPKMDFSKMESGYLTFDDRVETSNDFIEHKEVYYSFDADDNGNGTWQPLTSVWKNGTNKQEWQGNTVEIPCAGGQSNVRVKFVFDTRRDTTNPNPTGSNFAKQTDYDGWNIDNIKLVGRKAEPTDFYYYRQDLNSEFVTGQGAKLSSGPIADISGIGSTAAQVNTVTYGPPPTTVADTKFTNTVSGTTSSAADTVSFNLVSPINTTAPTTFENFHVNNADKTNSVSSAVTANITATGAFGTAISPGTTGATLLNPYFGQTTNIAVSTTAPFFNGQQISVGGTVVTVTNVGAGFIDVSAPGITGSSGTAIDFAPVAITSAIVAQSTNIPVSNTAALVPLIGQQIVIGGTVVTLTSLGIPGTINVSAPVTAAANKMVKDYISPQPSSKNLYWDITGTSTNNNTTSATISFVSGIGTGGVWDGTPPTINGPGVPPSGANIIFDNNPFYTDGTYQGIYDANDTLIDTSDELTMSSTSSITYNPPAQKPESSTTIDGIDLSVSSAATLTFDFQDLTVLPGPETDRVLELYNTAGTLVYTQHFPGAVGPQNISINLGTTVPPLVTASGSGETNVKAVFTVKSTDGLRSLMSSEHIIPYWVVNNIKVQKTDIPSDKVGLYTSTYETGVYNVTQPNSTVSFDYSGLSDPLGRIKTISRKAYYSSDNGVTWNPLFSADAATGSAVTYVNSGNMNIPMGNIKLKFESVLDIPSNVNVPAKNDFFDVRNISFKHTLGDGYNKLEVGAASTLAAFASPGDTTVTVTNGASFKVGDTITIGTNNYSIVGGKVTRKYINNITSNNSSTINKCIISNRDNDTI